MLCSEEMETAAEYVGINFCISKGAGMAFVVLVGLIDNDEDDVLLNDLEAFTTDTDRDLEAFDTFDQSTGENPGGGVAERAGGSSCGVDVNTSVSVVGIVVRSTSIGSLACRCSGDPTTSVTLGDSLIFNFGASSPGDEGVDPSSPPPQNSSSLPLSCGAKGAVKGTDAVDDDEGVVLMAVEVLALISSEYSLAAAFPTPGRAGLDTEK